MTIKYTVANWVFDVAAWAEALANIHPDETAAARELSGLTASGWRNWTEGRVTDSFKQPGMQNFINVCNLLELDPRDYFKLQ